MANNYKISVITPSFNQANYIERTIKSVLSQEVNFDYEVIVMDGGSTDGTLDILEKYAGRIKWISAKDKGQSDAINKGIELSAGEIIGWLNSDDIYLPGTLQKVVNYFESHPRCQWLYGQCKIIDEDDQETRGWLTRHKERVSSNYRYERLLTENFISQPSVFIKKEALRASGPIDLSLHNAMDFDLWLRLGRQSEPGVMADYLACFRIHGKSKSTRNFIEQFHEQYAIHKKYDKKRSLLIIHKMKIYAIIAVYWIMEKFQKQERKKSII